MKTGTFRAACLILGGLIVASFLVPSTVTAVVAKDTKLTLIHYPGYGFGGRLTDKNGHQLTFPAPARIKLFRNGVLVKKTTACGKGYYRIPMAVPPGTYVAKFPGQPGLKPSSSRPRAV